MSIFKDTYKTRILEILSNIPINGSIHKLTTIEEIYGTKPTYSHIRSFDTIKCNVLKGTNIKFKNKGGYLIRCS